MSYLQISKTRCYVRLGETVHLKPIDLNMASGYPAVDRLLAYLHVLHNTSGTAGSMTQNRGQNDLTQLLAQGRRGGLNMPIVERMMIFRRMRSNTTGNRSTDLANMGVRGQMIMLFGISCYLKCLDSFQFRNCV